MLKQQQILAGLAPATVVQAAVVTSVALGGAVLAGWWLDIAVLQNV